MINFHVAIEYISEMFYGKTIYKVNVNGTPVHRSRSYNKANATYEAEVEFASLFSRPTNIALSKMENGTTEYVKVSMSSNKKKV